MERENPNESQRQSEHNYGILLILILLVIMVIGGPVVGMRFLTDRMNQKCISNLKQLGLVLSLYANDNKDMFPPINSTKNNFIFDTDCMYPTYLSDSSLLQCPWADDNASTHPDGSAGAESEPFLTDDSYVYLGWMVTTDEEAEAFFKAYDSFKPDDYHKNISVPEGKGNAGSSTIHRLSAGVDRFLITDINFCGSRESGASIVPIIWDTPLHDRVSSDQHHLKRGGGFVLYLDGHVEYHEYGEFPMTEKLARLLEERRVPAQGGNEAAEAE